VFGEGKTGFEKVVAGSGGHGRNGEKKGKLNGFDTREAIGETTDDRSGGTRDARDHGKGLKQTNGNKFFGAEIFGGFGAVIKFG